MAAFDRADQFHYIRSASYRSRLLEMFKNWSSSKKLAFLFSTLLLTSGGSAAAFQYSHRLLPHAQTESTANSAAQIHATTSPANEQLPKSSSGGGQATVQGNTSGNAKAQVTVNGQTIPVPQNGSVQTTVPSNSGNVNVDIQSQSNSSSGSSHSSTSVNIHSDTTSASGLNNKEDRLSAHRF